MSQISISRDDMQDGSASISFPLMQRWGDSAGLIASVGCAVHCAAIPVLLSLLPSWGLGWLADPTFHQTMFVICFVFALIAFLPGLRKHKKIYPLLIGSCGLLLIGTAAFWGEQYCCDTTPMAGANDGSSSFSSPTALLPSIEHSEDGLNERLGSGKPTVKMPCLCDVAKECGDIGVECQHDVSYAMVPVKFTDSSSQLVSDKDFSLANGGQSASVWLVLLVKLLTPTGGLVLVMAHLFNQRLSCFCPSCRTKC